MSELIKRKSQFSTVGLGVLALSLSACTLQARGGVNGGGTPPPQPQQPPPAEEPAPAVVVDNGQDAPPPPPAEEPPVVEVAPPPIPARWAKFQRRQSIICNGAETLTLRDMLIDHVGDAMVINGSCKVRIKNSFIRGTRHGIVINGSATLSLVNSRVVGWDGSVQINGAAFLTARGNEFVGRINTAGSATFDDKGGNQMLPAHPPLRAAPRAVVQPSRPAPPPPPAGRTNAPPTDCGGNQSIRVANVIIDGGRTPAIRARGNCQVEIVNSVLRGDTAVNASGNAKVTIRRSELTGTRYSVRMNGNAEVTVRNSTVNGRVQRTGNSAFRDGGGNSMR